MLLATVKVSLRLKARLALLITLPDPSEPLIPPAPNCAFPALTVRPPVKVLLALRIIAPAPALTRPPSEMGPLNVACPPDGTVMVHGPSAEALFPPPRFTGPLNVIGVVLAILRLPPTKV